jgi:hypothetical protein
MSTQTTLFLSTENNKARLPAAVGVHDVDFRIAITF